MLAFLLGWLLLAAPTDEAQPEIPVLLEPESIEGQPPPATHAWSGPTGEVVENPLEGILAAEEGSDAAATVGFEVSEDGPSSSVWASSADITPDEAKTLADQLKGMWRDLQLEDERMIKNEENIAADIQKLRDAGISIQKVDDAVDGQSKLYNAGAGVLNQLLLSTQNVEGQLKLGEMVGEVLEKGVGSFDATAQLGDKAKQASEEELAKLDHDVSKRADAMLKSMTKLFLWSESATENLNSHSHMLVDMAYRLGNISVSVDEAEEKLVKLVSAVNKDVRGGSGSLPGAAALLGIAWLFQ